MKLLLDTCTFLWVISGSDRIPRSLREQICESSHSVYLSVVSVWEVVLKNQLGKLPLSGSIMPYILEQRERHLIDPLPLQETCLSFLTKLPQIHKDPFDRLLICQSLEHGMVIATPDEAIRTYPVKTIW